MLKFIVCEDDAEELNIAVQTITKSMMKYADIEYKVEKFQRYNEKLEKIINEPFDTKIYLLDVELPVVGGLEIASRIREQDDKSYIELIFATEQALSFAEEFQTSTRKNQGSYEEALKDSKQTILHYEGQQMTTTLEEYSKQ